MQQSVIQKEIFREHFKISKIFKYFSVRSFW